MTDDKDFEFKLPDLPSDEELGISPEDYDLLDEEGEIRSDMPADEAGSASPPGGVGAPERAAPPPGRSDARQEKAARRARDKAKKAAAKQAKKTARAAKRAAPPAAASNAAASGAGAAPRAKRRLFGGKKPTPSPAAAGGDTSEAEPPAGDKGAKAPPQPPGNKHRGPVAAALLLVVAFASGGGRSVPTPQPANAPPDVFSSARAMTDLIEIAREPHAPGSPEHARVREYLLARLTELGTDPQVQTSTSMHRVDSFVRAATVRNVVARIPGQESTGAVLITAHYDGRGISTAAGDDGVGVVTILEAVRAIQEGGGLRNDVIVLLTDAEELGLLGAKAFVEGHPWMDDVRMALSVEMRGGAGPSIMFETGDDSGWVIDAYRRGSPNPVANSVSFEVYRRMPNGTDFTEFKDEGVQGLNFAAIGRANIYHQRYDTPQNVSEGTLQHHGVNLLSMLRVLGNEDLASVRAPDPVYFMVPVLGLVVYGERWVIPLTMALVVMLAALVFLVVRRGLGVGGIVVGLVYSLAVMGAGAGAGWLMLRELPAYHPEAGALQGSLFHSEGWYVLALAAAVTLVALLPLGLIRRRYTVAHLSVGAAVVPLAASVALTLMAPLAAMNLQWPTLALLAAAGLLLLLGRERETGTLGTVTALALSIPVIVFLVFLVEFLWLAMSLRLAPVLGALLGMMLVMALPAVDALRRPNWWWAPLAALVLSGGFLGLGLLNASPSADRPAPSTLVFAQDRETGSAVWATSASADPESPGMIWASERVGEFGAVDTLNAFFVQGGAYRTRPADALALTGPATELVADGQIESQRTVRVALRSPLGPEMMTVRLPGTVRLTALNGRPLPTRDPSGAPVEDDVVAVQYFGTPEEALFLDLEVGPAAAAVELAVVEHSLRPEELVGDEAFRRPPDLAPNVNEGSDRAMIRSVVRVPLGGEGLEAPVLLDGSGATPSPSLPVAGSGGLPAAGTEGAAAPGPDGAQVVGEGEEAASRDSVPRPDTLPAEAEAPGADTLPPPGSEPVPDTTGTRPDTTDAAPDTTGTRPDTTDAAPDATGTRPDTTDAAPDTTGLRPDTTDAAPDTTGLRPDTTDAAPDATGAVRASSG